MPFRNKEKIKSVQLKYENTNYKYLQLVGRTQFVTYPLCATFRISLCTTYPQHICCGSISTEEAAIVITVSVNAPNKSFGSPQRKLHTIFAT